MTKGTKILTVKELSKVKGGRNPQTGKPITIKAKKVNPS